SHAGKQVIAKRFVVCAVNDEPGLTLYLCPAHQTLYGRLNTLGYLVGQYESNREEVKFRQTMHKVNLQYGQIVHALFHPQWYDLMEGNFADHLGFTYKPPALVEEGLPHLSFKFPYLIVIMKYAFP